MTLRPARPEDASSLAALSLEVWIGTYLRRGINAHFADYVLSEFTPARLEALIQAPDQNIIVSQNQDGIDGYIRVSHRCPDPLAGDHQTEVATLYVQPRHHGKGIGRALLSAGMRAAQEAGAASVWLTTNSENAPAIAFYLAQGFERIGITQFRIEDQAYQNDVFARALAP
ncbi:acetyltransferase, gnat family [Ruegeria sp. TrichCH4B]|nr:acetyltransferase, gnat family [Ruegeria sp. TrichCH4B]